MKFILLSLFVSTITVCNGRVLPDSIQGCKRSNPKINQCSTDLLNKLRPELEKGIASIKLPAVDPFKLNVVNVNKAIEGIQINGKFNDIVATGASKFIVEEVNLNPQTFNGKVKIKLPELKLNGGYDLTGKLLKVPLNIKGKMTGNFNGIHAVVDLKANEINDKGVKRLKITEINSKIKVDGGKLNLVESNPKNQQAADIAMSFFNENSAEVLQSLAPIIDETASEIIKSILSEMLEVIPSEELFPN